MRNRLAWILAGLIAVQALLRLVLISPLFGTPLQQVLVHAGNLITIAGLAFVLIGATGAGRVSRLCLAAVLALAELLLIGFDISALLSLPSGQKPMTLATAITLTCGTGGLGGCIREFPGPASALGLAWLGLIALFFAAFGALAEPARRALGRNRTRLLLGIALAPVLGLWLLRPATMIAFEPMTRFVFKSEFPAQPIELATLPRPDYRVLPSPEITPRPLVLIVVDSLRADAVELRPGQASNTPFLQSLAAGGSLRDLGPVVALCATSYCGINGILSSSDWNRLSRGPPLMLPDVLRANGYRSHYLLTGPHRRALNTWALYGPNVDTMLDDSSPDSAGLVDDRDQIRRLQTLQISDPQRSFIFIHLMSAHGAGLRFDRADAPASWWGRLFGASARQQDYPAFYRRGVRQADGVLRALFAGLAARGLGDALVIITADHGERLDGAIGHGAAIDLSTALVPLLVYDPKGGFWPSTSGGVPATIDAAPSLLKAAGIAVPRGWGGVALQDGMLRRQATSESKSQIGEVTMEGGRFVMRLCPRGKPAARCTVISQPVRGAANSSR